jgi:drug/metabolite transporter (DMT)-like permease
MKARDNPYLLLAIAALFWSGNHIVGRAMHGEVPPIGVSTLRWAIPTVALWFIARAQIARDWPAIRTHWKEMLWLGVTGGALFTALQYVGLQYTTALNVSVLNSLVPVLIVAAGTVIFRDRITPLQLAGIVTSSIGVLTIIARGEVQSLARLEFNWGDLIILFNMAVFAIYAACLRLQPKIHWLSFMFVFGAISSVATLPFWIWEWLAGYTLKPTWLTFGSILYVSIFPSVLALGAWNRGTELIGAIRAGPFLHLVPVYTAIIASMLLGEHLAPFHVAGFVLILAGVWLASYKSAGPA